MTTKTETRRGIPTRCPFCGDEDTLCVHISDVSLLTCTNCDAEIGPDDLRTAIAQYAKLLAWLDAAPAYED
jgi:uncharacterized protein (DUF983 family)